MNFTARVQAVVQIGATVVPLHQSTNNILVYTPHVMPNSSAYGRVYGISKVKNYIMALDTGDKTSQCASTADIRMGTVQMYRGADPPGIPRPRHIMLTATIAVHTRVQRSPVTYLFLTFLWL